MKANTSISIDGHILDRARAVSKADGENISAFMERAARHELMHLAGSAVAEWEQRHGVDVEQQALDALELSRTAEQAVHVRKAR
jgi:hypothetical protein